ncbi:MAG: hypothetical protein HRT38_15085 [Alteromonadaceae bacterium]|nr:hypothetical protein [Alteromonadaceae bacterium]
MSIYQVIKNKTNKDLCLWKGWLYIEKSTCASTINTLDKVEKAQSAPSPITTTELRVNDVQYNVFEYPGTPVLMNILISGEQHEH